MPCTATRRENAALVQLRGDSPHAGEPLRPQVIHDGPKVLRTVLCIRLHGGGHGLLVADLLTLRARAPFIKKTLKRERNPPFTFVTLDGWRFIFYRPFQSQMRNLGAPT